MGCGFLSCLLLMFLLLCFYELRKLTNNLADVTPSLILCESCTCRRSLYCSVPTNSLRKHLEGLKKELLKIKVRWWFMVNSPCSSEGAEMA